ncbi:hypothetical protein [Rhodovulum imhoffii]|uniref:hypothetical protein n=1 Tax=Rhodovulum imhoffii TaxID=365340 RepID=UPI000D3809A0|nr:hypothetical protein [Rhodovulum imhoffii]MBK5933527.1 hypothetical protein [Rhodovulum imhoffii]
MGYADGFDLIEDVAKNHDVVVEQINGRLMLVKREGQNRYVIAEYQPGGIWDRILGIKDQYYGVTTGFPDGYGQSVRGKTSLNRALNSGGTKLWEK